MTTITNDDRPPIISAVLIGDRSSVEAITAWTAIAATVAESVAHGTALRVGLAGILAVSAATWLKARATRKSHRDLSTAIVTLANRLKNASPAWRFPDWPVPSSIGPGHDAAQAWPKNPRRFPDHLPRRLTARMWRQLDRMADDLGKLGIRDARLDYALTLPRDRQHADDAAQALFATASKITADAVRRASEG